MVVSAAFEGLEAASFFLLLVESDVTGRGSEEVEEHCFERLLVEMGCIFIIDPRREPAGVCVAIEVICERFSHKKKKNHSKGQ